MKRKQQPLTNSSSSHQPPDKELSDHEEDDNIDLSPPTTAADPVTSRKNKMEREKRKQHSDHLLPCQHLLPTATNLQKKQITHVLSDDEDDHDENALIVTSCNNMDCKALLLENKTLKETLKSYRGGLTLQVKSYNNCTFLLKCYLC